MLESWSARVRAACPRIAAISEAVSELLVCRVNKVRRRGENWEFRPVDREVIVLEVSYRLAQTRQSHLP